MKREREQSESIEKTPSPTKRQEHAPAKAPPPYLHRYNRLIEELDNLYHTIATRLGVSDSVLSLLYAVKEHGDGCPIRTVRHAIGMPKQTLNSALRRLEAAGILTLSSAGGREKRILLTAVGKALTERTAARLMAAENAVFSAWDPAEVECYVSLTERFLHDLSREAERLGETPRNQQEKGVSHDKQDKT